MKDNPHGEVIGKLLEAMLGSRSNEQKIARLKWVSLSVMEEDSSATQDEVDLILYVWSCGARKRGEAPQREHRVQGSAPQKTDRVLTGGTWDTHLSLGKANHAATAGRAHFQD